MLIKCFTFFSKPPEKKIMSSPASFLSTNKTQRLPAVLASAPSSSTFARWDDPLGRYAHSYMIQAEALLARLKSIAGAINEQLQHQEKLKKEEEERNERIKYTTPPKKNKDDINSNSNNTAATQVLDFTQETASMIFPNTTKLDILIARLEQQLLVGNRLRKIIEHYSVQPNERMMNSGNNNNKLTSTATSNSITTIVGGVAWCAVAGQVKAALAGFLQQLRLDMLCAASVLIEAERRKFKLMNGNNNPNTDDPSSPSSRLLATEYAIDQDPAEGLVSDVAKSLFTINNEIYRLVNEVSGPLVEKASTSLSSVMESMLSFSSPSSASLRTNNNNNQNGAMSSARRSNLGSEAGGSTSAHTTTTTTKQNAPTTIGGGGGSKQQQQTVVTLNSSCSEYLSCLAQSSDPVVTALSVACRGHEHLHRTHVDMLRGLMSNVVLGLIRRHSLLTGAVRMIRDISQKYHRIVEGQTALRTIRKSVALVMSPDDKIPEPAEALLEVDALGRLLQEMMATATVMKETCTVLRHWAFESNAPPTSGTGGDTNNNNTAGNSSAFPVTPTLITSSRQPQQRHAFDNPSQVRTAMAQHHTKTNGQYLLTTLRSMTSLLRRIAVAADKTLTTWSEPALNAFGKILEVHTAPLLQCARVMANAQTDMKQLIGLCREKAVMVEETRAIEDTIAVLGNAATSTLIYTSLDQQLREIETLSRTIHSIAARSTAILNEVVTTLCKPISQFSQHLPFQFIDIENDTLTSSLQQLCKQHDSIIENLKATTSTTASANANNNATTTASLSLQEMTTSMNSARLMSESEQRAVAASCSFDRLGAICNEIDSQCDRWFKNRFTTSKKPISHLSQQQQQQVHYNTTQNLAGTALQDDESLLDDEALDTAGPAALLPISVRNEDRLLAMNVLRGTMRHLQAGEESFLVVPRPDRVASPSALNDFEDEFSVAFVGVEGLCEQVFSSHNAMGLPQIAIASASSLDVLAKVGAIAANQNQNNSNNFNQHHQSISKHQQQQNAAATTASRMSQPPQRSMSNNNNHQHYLHARSNSGSSSVGGGFEPQLSNDAPLISITTGDNNNNTLSVMNSNNRMGLSSSTSSPLSQTHHPITNNNPVPVTSRAGRNRGYTTIVNPNANNNSGSPQSQMQEQKSFLTSNFAHTSVSNNNSFASSSHFAASPIEAIKNNDQSHFSTASRLLQSPGNNRLRSGTVNVRSFTYQAAMAMPEHEMVPPGM